MEIISIYKKGGFLENSSKHQYFEFSWEQGGPSRKFFQTENGEKIFELKSFKSEGSIFYGNNIIGGKNIYTV